MDMEDKETLAQLKRKIADRKEKLREQRFGRRRIEGAEAEAGTAGLGGATGEEDKQAAETAAAAAAALQQKEQEAKDEAAKAAAETETRRTDGV